MKSILLHIRNDSGQGSRLQAALDLARATGGHIHCHQVQGLPHFVSADPFGGGLVGPPIAVMQDIYDRQRVEIEARLNREDVAWDWGDSTGNAGDALTHAARLADIVVLSIGHGPAGEGGGHLPMPLHVAADVAIHARRPVLAVPVATRGIDFSGPALVAWNGSAEAAQALRAALPLLRLARGVRILGINAEEHELSATHAAEYLALHGIMAEPAIQKGSARSVEAAIDDAVRQAHAAYLVMGAYGHNRVYELIFGGVTRHMMVEAGLPLLLAH